MSEQTQTNRMLLLHKATMEGNVPMLLELLHQDPLLLDRVNNNKDSIETPLHVASLLGHERFVDEILKRRPQMAKELNYGGSSALHLAAAKGFVPIVKLLLQVDADLCLLWDADGWNPLHLAIVRGRVDVVAELISARPMAARTVVDGDSGTALHLCVKYNQLEALKMLIQNVGADDSFVNAQDDHGFTILHLAVSKRQLRTVKYLIDNTGIEVNALTSFGLTPLDILIRSDRDLRDMNISHTLTAAGAFQTTTTTTISIFISFVFCFFVFFCFLILAKNSNISITNI